MKSFVEKVPAFSVIGLMGQGPAKFSPYWVRPLWRRFYESYEQIRHLVVDGATGESGSFWGLISDRDRYLYPWQTHGRYLAGCMANAGVSAPQGFSLWHVPERTCLIVPCRRTQCEDVRQEVIKQLLNSRSYRLSAAVIERFPTAHEEGQMQLYFPIRRVITSEVEA